MLQHGRRQPKELVKRVRNLLLGLKVGDANCRSRVDHDGVVRVCDGVRVPEYRVDWVVVFRCCNRHVHAVDSEVLGEECLDEMPPTIESNLDTAVLGRIPLESSCDRIASEELARLYKKVVVVGLLHSRLAWEAEVDKVDGGRVNNSEVLDEEFGQTRWKRLRDEVVEYLDSPTLRVADHDIEEVVVPHESSPVLWAESDGGDSDLSPSRSASASHMNGSAKTLYID